MTPTAEERMRALLQLAAHQSSQRVKQVPIDDLPEPERSQLHGLWRSSTTGAYNLWGEPYIIAGGAVRAVFDRLPTNDVDVFSTGQAPQWVVCSGAKEIASAENGIYVRPANSSKLHNYVTTFHGSPVEILLGFDLECCQVACDECYVYFTAAFCDSVAGRRLSLNWNIIDTYQQVLKTMERIMKYIGYGYKPPEPVLTELASRYAIYREDTPSRMTRGGSGE